MSRVKESVKPLSGEPMVAGVPKIEACILVAVIVAAVFFRDAFPKGVTEAAFMLVFGIYSVIHWRIIRSSLVPLTLMSAFPAVAIICIIFGFHVTPDAIRYLLFIIFGAASGIVFHAMDRTTAIFVGKWFSIMAGVVSLICCISFVLYFNESNILSFTMKGTHKYARSQGFLVGPNYFAISLFFSFIVGVALTMRGHISSIVPALIASGIFIAGSRAVFLSLTVFVGAIFFLEVSARRVLFRVMIFSAAFCLMIYIATPGEVIDAMAIQRIEDGTGGGIARLRHAFDALNLFVDGNWFLGYGRGVYPEKPPHNSFLTILVDYGIVGLASFTGILGYSILLFFRRRRQSAAPLAIVLSLSAAATFNDYHLTREWWMAFSTAWLVFRLSALEKMP